ncbi:MAG TPA: hypothetical protein P5550_08230 [Bacteroidales bacterium]|nr:hypothetical protein [Bacteroidales bacterium]
MRHISLIILMAMLLPMAGHSQDESKGSWGVSADLVSRYVWRGLEFGNSPAVQPGIEYSRGMITAGCWGSYATNGANYQEADLYVTLTPVEAFSITFTDYFFPDHSLGTNHYFNYDGDRTGHVMEGAITFNGTEKLPLRVMAAVNFYGADARKANGDLMYSTYAELGYSTEISSTSCDLFLGFSPNKADTDKGETGFYGDKPGIINLGITGHRDIRVSESFTLPVFTSLIVNPQAENIFLVFGLSI